MRFYPNERLALFIDGANLCAASSALGFEVDFRRLRNHFQRQGQLVRALYYTALVDAHEWSETGPLVDWLGYNGYATVTKSAKAFIARSGRRAVNGKIGVDLAVDAIRLADFVDHIVLFSGDGDFCVLISRLQEMGKHVSVISTLETRPPMIADQLRRQADHFLDLASLASIIAREV